VALEGLKRGGEFNAITAEIVLSTGKLIKLESASILSLTIFENINEPAMSGKMIFQDSINLGSVGPLIGQEYLKIKITTPSVDDEDFMLDSTNQAYMVTSVRDRQDIGNGVQAAMLEFVSREMVINNRQRVRRTLVGSYSEIVEELLEKDLMCSKKLFVESSADNKKIVSTNNTPYSIIRTATKHAISSNHRDATYCFWETSRGLNFRTLGNMYNQAQYDIMSYIYTIPGTRYANGRLNMDAEIKSIENWKITGGPNTLVNYGNGAYSSDLIVHDILSKSYKKTKYNYLKSFDSQVHVDGDESRPLTNPLNLTLDGENVSSFPSRQYLKPAVGSAIDKSHGSGIYNSFSNDNFPKSIQSRNSQMAMIQNGLAITIDVVGNTLVCAGDIVTVIIPNTAAYIEGNDTQDSLYNGSFLVTDLRHDFDFETYRHKMSMRVVKDSMNKKISSPSDNTEPSDERGLRTIKLDSHYDN
tara:strand:+ start:395 stop:1807 length:1413 start_codon:yes stop_codon:yes gene_type:complete